MKTRECKGRDVDAVVHMTMAMLREMASHGGRNLNEEQRVRSQLRTRFLSSLQEEGHVTILGTGEERDRDLRGMAEASIITPAEIFRRASILRVHALYVLPDHRRHGIGRELLEAVLSWGRKRGCDEAELSVLAANPARGLYESVGFEVSELEMRMDL